MIEIYKKVQLTFPETGAPPDETTPVNYVGRYVQHEGDTSAPVYGFVKLTVEELRELLREGSEAQ